MNTWKPYDRLTCTVFCRLIPPPQGSLATLAHPVAECRVLYMQFDLYQAITARSMPEHTGISDDLDLLIDAMKPVDGKRFLTISSYGAGEPAIALASHGAERILAYDVEDSGMLRQLILFKMAAARTLSHSEFLRLMGVRPANKSKRLALFRQVQAVLTYEEGTPWRNRQHWMRKGLYFSNRQTLFVYFIWALVCLLTSKKVRHEMVFGTMKEHRSMLFRRHVAKPWLVRLRSLIGSRVNFFYPSAEWMNSSYLRKYNRNPFPYFEHLVRSGLSSNPIFSQYFHDQVIGVPDEMLPPHMRPGAYMAFKSIGGKIEIVDSPPKRAPRIEVGSEPYHGAYISNVIDYLNLRERVILCKEVSMVLKPDSPVLVYSSESFERVPLGCGLQLDAVTSRILKETDKVRTYTQVCLYRVVHSS